MYHYFCCLISVILECITCLLGASVQVRTQELTAIMALIICVSFVIKKTYEKKQSGHGSVLLILCALHLVYIFVDRCRR